MKKQPFIGLLADHCGAFVISTQDPGGHSAWQFRNQQASTEALYVHGNRNRNTLRTWKQKQKHSTNMETETETLYLHGNRNRNTAHIYINIQNKKSRADL